MSMYRSFPLVECNVIYFLKRAKEKAFLLMTTFLKWTIREHQSASPPDLQRGALYAITFIFTGFWRGGDMEVLAVEDGF